MRAVVSALLCLTLFVTAGCGAVLVGGGAALGTYAYMNGRTTGNYATPLDKAYTAAKGACAELGIPITMEEKDGGSATVEGKYGGESVTISMELIGFDVTEITVRVGLWGNETSSRRIHNAITSRL